MSDRDDGGVEQIPDQQILPNGAEIHFQDERGPHSADRVEFLPGGWVKAVYKRSYEVNVFPPGEIRGIYTHTNHLEDKDWWDEEVSSDV